MDQYSAREERFVGIHDGCQLWAEASGDIAATTVLLVMGGGSSGMIWPDELVDRLAGQHRVIRYDHRDTGRSTWSFDEQPYALRDLATDAVAVLDDFGVEQAHVVGMSMGGTLTQLLLTDQPERLLSATLLCTSSVDHDPEAESLPSTDPELQEFWSHLDETRERDEELASRVEHWRLLNGDQLPFDAEHFRDLELRLIEHAGRFDNPTGHALADQSGLDRDGQLGDVHVPTLVIDAPADPVYPPPHAQHLAAQIPDTLYVTIPGMGHALPPSVTTPLAETILAFTAAVDADAP